MRVLGLDLSTASNPRKSKTGWAIVENGSLLTSGCLPEDTREWSKVDRHDRIVMIASSILKVIQDFNPGWIYAEAVYSRFVNVSAPLFRLQGAVIYAASLAGKQVNLIVTSEWRKILNAKNVMKKGSAISIVEDWLRNAGIPFSGYSEDEIEAIGIALAGHIELTKAGV